MIEIDPICDGIEVLNKMNESNELLTEEIHIDGNVEFLKSFSLSPPQNISTRVIDSNANTSIPFVQSNKKSMQLKIKYICITLYIYYNSALIGIQIVKKRNKKSQQLPKD